MEIAANRMSGYDEFSLTGLPVQARVFDSVLQEKEVLRAEENRVSERNQRGQLAYWSRKPNWFKGGNCFKIWPPLLHFFTANLAQKTQLQLYSFRMPLRGHASPSRGRNSGKKAKSGGRGAHNP